MKFIQITSARLENNAQTQANWILHALDSDGRIWELDDHHGWREVPLPTPSPDVERCKHGIVIVPGYVCLKCFREPDSAQETPVARCSHGVPIDPAIPCERCGQSPMTTCAKCGVVVNILGINPGGWIDVEPHKCHVNYP